MKNKRCDYYYLIAITIIFICLIIFGKNYFDNKFGDVYVSFTINNDEYIVKSYFNEEENVNYLFLPSHYLKNNMIVKLNKNIEISLENKTYKEKVETDDIKYGIKYDVKKNGSTVDEIIFMHSKNIPSMYINTSSKKLDYLKQDKDNYDSGWMMLVNEDGTIDYNDRISSISGRGNSTWRQYKRGWALELENSSNLLGMNDSSSWVLFANTYDDTAGLRNYSAYNMALNVGLQQTSKLRFIDLYIDNDYQGTYLLCEKIEERGIGNLDELNNIANKCILDFEKLRYVREMENGKPKICYSEIVSPNDITGGYIIERNYGYKLEDKPYVLTTNGGESFVVRYPSILSKDEAEYVLDKLNCVESAIFSDNYQDNDNNKIDDLIDVDSWVLKYLVDETSKNEGAGTTSSYFYLKQNDHLLYGGPIWDYDKSFGNFERWKNPNGLEFSGVNYTAPTYWYKRLYYNDEVNRKIKQYYIERFRPYMCELSDYLLDEWQSSINDSYNMNRKRWNKQMIDYDEDYDLRCNYLNDMSNSVNYMKEWINLRIKFLDSVWIESE